jgi:transposase
VPTRIAKATAPELLDKNAELRVRLAVSESLAAQRERENQAQRQEIEQLKAECEQLKAERARYCERATVAEEELRWFKETFLRSSKKADFAAINPAQGLLFNEAEVLAAIEAADQARSERTSKVEAHVRKHTGGRKPIPKHFPRIVVTHDLPEEQKMCTKCPVPHPLTRIGEEVRECYVFQPPKISVEQHIKYTYVCEERKTDVVTAAAPPVILPKTNASASLVAHLVSSKFDYGMPIYRVSRQLQHSGMDLSPGTAGTWVNIVGHEKVVPVINLLNDELFSNSLILMDETYLQVLKSDKAPSADHFMVIRAAGPPGKRIILYNYLPSRTQAGLKELLIGAEGPYRGKLLTDGLEQYDAICAELNLLHFGCFQHCRQYFIKAQKVSELPSSRTLASAALDDYIRPVFKLEDRIEELRLQHEQRGESLPPEVILQMRQQQSKPLLEQFKGWVDKLLPATPPKSALGKALAYTTNQWEKLERHLDHPDVPIHNNFVEQQNKHYAVGRKAWLFAHDHVGAQASANLYSLVLTCRVNGIQPFDYLEHLFELLPAAATVADVEALLPWNVKPTLEQRRKDREELARQEAMRRNSPA